MERRRATQVIPRFILAVALLLLFIPSIEASNTIASNSTSNGSSFELTSSAWYQPITANVSIGTSTGTTVIIGAIEARTNSTGAKLRARILRDGAIIWQMNVTESAYIFNLPIIATYPETAGTHTYALELANPSGKKTFVNNWTFGVTSVMNGAYLTEGITNATANINISQVNLLQGLEDAQNTSILNLQANGTYANLSFVKKADYDQNFTNATHASAIEGLRNNDTSDRNFINNTYNGTTLISTLGTILWGVWQATPIADAYVASSAVWNAYAGTISLMNVSSARNDTYRQDNDTLIRNTLPLMNESSAKNDTYRQDNDTLIRNTLVLMNASTAANDTYRQDNDTRIWNSTALNDTYRQNNDTLIRDTLVQMNTSSALNNTNSQNRDDIINTTVAGVQNTLPLMNQSSNANDSASRSRDETINGTKVNKTDAGEFTGGTLPEGRLSGNVILGGNATYPTLMNFWNTTVGANAAIWSAKENALTFFTYLIRDGNNVRANVATCSGSGFSRANGTGWDCVNGVLDTNGTLLHDNNKSIQNNNNASVMLVTNPNYVNVTNMSYLRNYSLIPGANTTITDHGNGSLTISSSGSRLEKVEYFSGDGVTVNFTTTQAIQATTSRVYVNGVRQREGSSGSYEEYSTYVSFASPPVQYDLIEVEYV